jgi:putative hydrolase of the HAD superfamily
MKLSGIKVVALDLQGVVFTEAHTVRNILAPMFPDLGYGFIRSKYDRYIVGEISDMEFWSGLAKNPAATEKKFLDAIMLDPEFNDTAAYLKKKYRLAVLSDTTKEWKEYLFGKHKLSSWFDTVVISSDTGYSKPNEKIFEIFLQKVGVDPTQCVFVDDRLENLEAAAGLEMKTVQYEREPPRIWFKPDFTIKRLGELKGIL